MNNLEDFERELSRRVGDRAVRLYPGAEPTRAQVQELCDVVLGEIHAERRALRMVEAVVAERTRRARLS